MDDLHALPKIRDSLSYLYVEHSRIDRHEKSIAIWDARGGYAPVPAAALCVLMLGPGTSVTHAAIEALADNNCLVVWCGEENVRFYAFGTGGTRSAAPLLLQARLASDENLRLAVVKRMYRMRFREWPEDAESLSIEQLRGLEGARMRAVYADASRKWGVPWDGRNYDRSDWGASDPVNRALSAANACLYGLCHAALLATGYSPGISFIHSGKQLSFVYDLADLYKTEVTIPVAFEVASEARSDPEIARNVERAARLRCRDRFRETKLLTRIVPDLQKLFGGKDVSDVSPPAESLPHVETPAQAVDFDTPDKSLPGGLWAPASEGGTVAGGVAYGAEKEAARSSGSPVGDAVVDAVVPAPALWPPSASSVPMEHEREAAASSSAVKFLPEEASETAAALFAPDEGCEIALCVPRLVPSLPWMTVAAAAGATATVPGVNESPQVSGASPHPPNTPNAATPAIPSPPTIRNE